MARQTVQQRVRRDEDPWEPDHRGKEIPLRDIDMAFRAHAELDERPNHNRKVTNQ